MAQYPTPQFIEQEGKIIYFLTFKQFFLLVGGLSTAIVFYYLLPFYFFVICSIVIMGIVSVIAFIKIDNASLVTVFLHFFGFLFENKTYIWEKKKSPYPYKSLNPNLQSKEKLITRHDNQEINTTKPSHFSILQASKLKEVKKKIETKK